MTDCVTREAAATAIDEFLACIFVTPVGKSIMEKVPAVDVQPVVPGEWIIRGGVPRCSVCGTKALLRLESNVGGCKEYEYCESNVCPKCGAIMKRRH